MEEKIKDVFKENACWNLYHNTNVIYESDMPVAVKQLADLVREEIKKAYIQSAIDGGCKEEEIDSITEFAERYISNS